MPTNSFGFYLMSESLSSNTVEKVDPSYGLVQKVRDITHSITIEGIAAIRYQFEAVGVPDPVTDRYAIPPAQAFKDELISLFKQGDITAFVEEEFWQFSDNADSAKEAFAPKSLEIKPAPWVNYVEYSATFDGKYIIDADPADEMEIFGVTIWADSKISYTNAPESEGFIHRKRINVSATINAPTDMAVADALRFYSNIVSLQEDLNAAINTSDLFRLGPDGNYYRITGVNVSLSPQDESSQSDIFSTVDYSIDAESVMPFDIFDENGLQTISVTGITTAPITCPIETTVTFSQTWDDKFRQYIKEASIQCTVYHGWQTPALGQSIVDFLTDPDNWAQAGDLGGPGYVMMRINSSKNYRQDSTAINVDFKHRPGEQYTLLGIPVLSLSVDYQPSTVRLSDIGDGISDGNVWQDNGLGEWRASLSATFSADTVDDYGGLQYLIGQWHPVDGIPLDGIPDLPQDGVGVADGPPTFSNRISEDGFKYYEMKVQLKGDPADSLGQQR